ncbi:MAG: hypothetical protein J0G96_04980 [Flavobacteriia bacterium]|nr:hypothetical protein [Flavobacteriia bacterium]OJX35308.1 MAG: hypothetical protein BGO87_11930 [Flavobacteriia bacterium 40-80]
MKKIIFIAFILLGFHVTGIAQKANLQNAVVVGLFDRKDERFQMEILLSELLLENKIKAKVSLNFLKEGADVTALANDSVQQLIAKSGFDTYVLMAVRGYDKKFKPATQKLPLGEELSLGHLFPIYREEISNVTFEFKFYKGNEMTGYSMVKIPASSKESMLKKFRLKMGKQIKKHW